MKSLLLAVLALVLVHRVISQPHKPLMVGEGRDWLSHCRNGGGA